MTNTNTIKSWILENLLPTTYYSSNAVSANGFAERVKSDMGVDVSPDEFTGVMAEMGFTIKPPDGENRTFPIFMCKGTPSYLRRHAKTNRYNKWYVKK